MDSVNNSTKTCPHRVGSKALWVKNDAEGAPILYFTGREGPVVMSLTNQVIRVSCPECFRALQGILLDLQPDIRLNS